MVVIGKALGNGYPIAAVGGPAEIMDSEYFVSSTYAGEISSLAAARAVIKTLRENPNYKMESLINEGLSFVESFNSYASKLGFSIQSYGTRGVFTGNEISMALFFQEACKAGIIFGKSFFVSFSHLKYLKQTLLTCRDIIEKISSGKVKLEGRVPKSPFSLQVRG